MSVISRHPLRTPGCPGTFSKHSDPLTYGIEVVGYGHAQ